MTAPLVSIILLTYNHRPYIEDAVAGILAQRVAFNYEILICEDCSTDGTREFVVDLQRQHPDRIRLFLSERNQNDNEVFTRAWRFYIGRYIAFIDGDDYWTEP
jgi:glycosyltransferase involved in cell wall biosynthesis